MATYRTIRMDFWNDPYVEGMEPQDKLLYVYLFSSPHTNNLGVLTVSRRKIAFETGLTEEGVAAGLAALERDGKVLIDGGAIWVCNFVRHQCTTSPKLLLSLRALFPTAYFCACGYGIRTHRRIGKETGKGKRRSDRDGRFFCPCGYAGGAAARLPGR